jgi:hypothetical protein
MTNPLNPYRGLPSRQYWRDGVTGVGFGQFDPIESVKFQIQSNELISTLGSCFAQHLAKHIRECGYNYFAAEPVREDEELTDEALSTANQFSARYGNVYTVRQALQLIDRSEGWEPKDDIWERDGRFYDAFRPNVFPQGFSSEQALRDERKRHLKSVQAVFSKSDVVVFTLGLTEAWMSRQDGAVYPIAPGVSAGSMVPTIHEFRNFSYSEVADDLKAWCLRLRSINSSVRIILTVSPVPLNATYEDQNVWISNTYSKATLRAAAGDVANSLDFVDYFPSYEIITFPQTQGRYYEDDLREVKEIGVRHVMRVFDKHYLVKSEPANYFTNSPSLNFQGVARSEGFSDIFCDEDLLSE